MIPLTLQLNISTSRFVPLHMSLTSSLLTCSTVIHRMPCDSSMYLFTVLFSIFDQVLPIPPGTGSSALSGGYHSSTVWLALTLTDMLDIFIYILYRCYMLNALGKKHN